MTIPLIVKDNFLTNEELTPIIKETNVLLKQLRSGKYSAPAREPDGTSKKQNKALAYQSYYSDSYKFSPTVQTLNRKIFNENLYAEFDSLILRGLQRSIDWAANMISYYEDDDYYKPHYDGCLITGLYWFDIKPRKFSGGEFCLYKEIDADKLTEPLIIKPLHNRFIAFPSCLYHAVKPVILDKQWKNQGHGRIAVSTFCGHGGRAK
ncbi:2OG-Fe(II) oxygenase superfamily domain containing protein [Synechococcus phage S-CAM9]|uniref:2OG-Fe(II) oxygenase superfamily domain containing protein n=1 Tax=Synechococcus phage S-CAM9 TaxID=1883369 RepID=A0A1D8KPB9_9CAUD|nr:2OG-Fe(II) oxygenase superfamily domain containing protein [Synechococcus phage S-CAM9]AOV60169.1 2OG-Fe(II) oxygenase superfamily domain containing protein [Synechococcus phage S-CAM9]AOV60397.1 2OG-Fe(II) oxygenase superfamily domain containing protein [Synechococcus phage S-CAM9]AOV60625.1 2OG-Fe(II) oxygenase superfamily domain containing protein [Synechococcus phage S-CAM9]